MLAEFAWEYPFASFGLCLSVLALPFLAALRFDATGPGPQWIRWYRRLTVAVGMAVAATAASRYFVAAHPAIDGVDFYFYLCFGRDLLHGVPDPTLAKYAYFPGGYRYWELVMALFGEDLPTLQLAFVCTLAANAALCGAIVTRCVKSAGAGVLAGLCYLALASRFEGMDGTTEPLSTLFALSGLLAWGGMPLQGTAGWRRALLLGAGLGLAAWIKQQGGLVALGAGVLAINFVMNPPAVRDRFWQVLAVPAAASFVFIIAMLLEGHGLAPLHAGLHAVREYEAHGSLTKNLLRLAGNSGSVVWFVLAALYFWTAILGSSFTGGARQAPWISVVGYSLIAALATFTQFAKREYPHYGLLSAPYLAIAVTIMAVRAAQTAGAVWPRLRPFIAIATAGVLVLPAVNSMGRVGYFQIWPIVWNPIVSHQRVWHDNPSDRKLWHQDPDVASDLQSLSALIARGEDVLILPPRQNVIHFLTGSVSLTNPHGYGWGPMDASQTIRSPSLDAVVVLHPRTFERGDALNCKYIGCDRAVSALPGNGFRISAAMASMTLWRREPPGPPRAGQPPDEPPSTAGRAPR